MRSRCRDNQRLPGALILFWGLVGGCIWPSEEPYLAGDDPAPLVVVSSSPDEGAEAVPTDGPVVFRFDGPVHPDSVSVESVRLAAGSDPIGASRRVDLLDCTVTLTPHEPLLPRLSHRVEVSGVYGFRAGPLDPPLAVTFTTGDATAARPADPVPTLPELVRDVFSVHCAVCHGDHQPPGGVDLSTEESVARTLIGQPSRFRSGATHVVAGSHANSYLMWKLLDLPPIEGERMPPEGSWPGEQLCGEPHAGLRGIAAWIDAL